MVVTDDELIDKLEHDTNLDQAQITDIIKIVREVKIHDPAGSMAETARRGISRGSRG